jgi:hypothetical protein
MAAAALLASLPCPAETLQNAGVRLTIDGRGNLVELTNVATGRNYAGGKPVWGMFYRRGDAWENGVDAAASAASVTRRGEALVIRYEKVAVRGGSLAVELELQARLVDDEVRWSARVTNREPGVIVTELQFPLLQACRIQPGQSLITSLRGGHRYDDPRAAVRAAHTLYMAPDQHGVQMTLPYPGTAATNCFTFAGADQGLYFASYDPTFQQTVHLWRLVGDELGAGLVKYPFLTTGKTFQADGYVTSPYRGDWRVAARKYRAWADGWFRPARPPAWIESMTGWQRVIAKHQYGEVLNPYREAPRVVADGIAAGVRTLLYFGWHTAGMDAGYPDYSFDEGQGGRAALAESIRKIHQQGGRVHLYFNGRLIDKESEFYRRGGSRVSIKDWRGNELTESYHFSGDGTAVRQYGRKSLVVACPAMKEWREMTKRWADQALDAGADSVFYDQLGYYEYPCCDPSHGHPTPFTAVSTAKASLLRELHEHIRKRGAEKALGTEWLCDLTSQHADFYHNVTGSSAATNDWRRGAKPRIAGFVEWFRYAFPEVIVSDREIRDDTDVERRVNHALLLGLRSDVEVYRCRGTIADAPVYREYLKKANALREKYADLILSGRYCDADHFRLSNGEVEGRSFTRGDRMAVVATQSHLERAAVEITAPGYRLAEHGGLGAYSAKASAGGVAVELGRHALVVAVFVKQ